MKYNAQHNANECCESALLIQCIYYNLRVKKGVQHGVVKQKSRSAGILFALSNKLDVLVAYKAAFLLNIRREYHFDVQY